MEIEKRLLSALGALGLELQQLPSEQGWEATLHRAYTENAWFTPEAVTLALHQWGQLLREDHLQQWLQPYTFTGGKPLTVGLVLAGNIPLVGFHDLLSVLVTGNRALVKCASNDRILVPFLWNRLKALAPDLEGRVSFTEGKLTGHDAVIATGSNNTARYFEHYFQNTPHIIRKNRNSVAVLDGTESPEELQGLALDVFQYFGMGCRSISKLLVPEGYDFEPLFNAFYAHRAVVDHTKYGNNYDYNKAVYLMSGSPMLDNGFLLLKEDEGLGSPIGTLFYSSYPTREELKAQLSGQAEQLQCIAAHNWMPGAIPFGTTQSPGLDTYADGVDTVDFLLKTMPK